jgi:hypothetical protein
MANRYWVASTDGTFSSSFNWSTSSGGSSGASVPDTTTVAIFDSNGVGRCILTSNIEILDLVVSSGYTGSMVQGSSVMSMRDATFAGGSFSGGSGNIIVSNALNLTGTDFTSTSGSLYVYKNFNCSSVASRFHHNDGTVVSYAQDKRFDPNGINFNCLTFARDSIVYDHQFVDSTCTVSKNLVLSGGYLRTGYDSTVIAYGNIYCNAGFGRLDNEHDALIHLMGPCTQLCYADGGVFPHLYVDKSTTNQVKAFGDYPIYINGDFIIFDGTFNTNGHDIIQGNLESVPSPSVYVVDFTWGLYPGTPSDLTAFTVSSTEVGLTWTDTATDETGFKVERSLDGTVFSQIATVVADSTNYDDTGLSGGTQYWYRVRSYNDVGDSPYSNIDDATTETVESLNYLNDLAYGSGSYVGITDSGLFRSIDKTNWSSISSTDSTIRSICYGGGFFVAVGSNGYISYSSNGTSWSDISSSFTPTYDDIYDIAYAPDGTYYLAVNGPDAVYAYTLTLPGEVVTQEYSIEYTEPDRLYTVCAGYWCVSPSESNKVFVQFLGKYDYGPIDPLRLYYYLSNWTEEVPFGLNFVANNSASWIYPRNFDVPSTGFPHHSFIAVGDSGNIKLHHTVNFNWGNQACTSPTSENLYGCVGDSSGRLVVVGDNGTIVTCELRPGMDFTGRSVDTTQTFKSVIWDGTSFIAVGLGKKIAESIDCTNWYLHDMT